MAISIEQIKQLREKTGAGMMDCKRALEESNGDMEQAVVALRKKGIQVATKREGKTASEGIVYSYIHAGSQVGTMVEINCETDFVARSEPFVNFAKEVAMQIAAMQPRYIGREDVPPEDLDKEREILVEQAKAEGKPDHIVEKIVEGRLNKFYSTYCLLEQPYVRDDSLTIQDLLNDLMAKTGEKIVIRRFVRYQVGEEL